ncbi:unnamed protein product [Leuciscus chuanchicus]
MVLEESTADLILGRSWMIQHQPLIDWDSGEIFRWSENCFKSCLSTVQRMPKNSSSSSTQDCQNLSINSTSIESPEVIHKVEIPEEYRAFQDVFSKQLATKLPPHRPWDCAVDLLPGATLSKGRVYPLSIPEQKAMEEYIEEALQQQFIRPSTSPAASSCFFVSKKDGSLRPCIDYRHLNSQTVKFSYPLPLGLAALEQLRGALIFSKLDLRSAYNLIRIRRGDEWKMAFITPSGHYEYRVMPYGLSNSPAVFQGYMNEVFREFLNRFVVVYIDDILIYSRNLTEHRHHVTQVLEKLCADQLYLKLEKCEFHTTSVQFLGHVIDQHGIQMDQRKVDTIWNWPQPTTVKELQRFLGFANFYRKFNNYSLISSPLTSTLKGRPKSLSFTPEASNSFQQLKEAFQTAPILAHPNPDIPFIVEPVLSVPSPGASSKSPKENRTNPAPPGGPEGLLYVPPPLRLDSAHTSPGSGHPGSRRTLSLLHQRYWWPSMPQDVSRFVKGTAEKMSNLSSSSEKQNVKGVSFKQRRDSAMGTPVSSSVMSAFPEGPPVLDYREPEPPPKKHKYQQSLKTLIPLRFASHSHPVDDAGFFSFTSFAWMTPMMWRLFRNRLNEDFPSLSHHDGAHINGERFQRLWDDEVARVGLEKASLPAVVIRFQKTRLIVSFLASVLFTFAVFIGPSILVYEILNYVEHPETSTLLHGVGVCVALFTTEFSKAFFASLMWALNLRTAVRVKGAFNMLAFKKIISLRNLTSISVGETINVLTSDGYRMFEAVLFGTFLLCVPLLLIICIIYACFILGYTALIGILVYLVFLPIQFSIARLISVFRRRAISVTDRRVRTMNEVLTCIKLIKMYAWEESFEKAITDIRKNEKLLLQKAGYVQSLNSSLTTIVPTLATILTFIVHTALKLPLQPSTAYTIIAVFNCMRMSMGLLPFSVKAIAEAKVALARLKKLMLVQNPIGYLTQDKNMDLALVMEKASFSWSLPDDTEKPQDPSQSATHQSDSRPSIRSISFTLSKGSLLGVCGNVGSGKTSLISSILEQMHLVSGSVSANGTFAYVSQQAWIFHGTVRDNILMGEPFDQTRYDSVIHACCLKPDLAILPYGDQTEIGERGINLSGGQKQRVSLARAVYSNRDIFLLDDPLSAVDAHVGKHIFEECIKKELKGKSVILVTHQLQYLEFCDEVLLLDNGEIKEAGTHSDLMKAKGRYTHLINNVQMEQSNENIEADSKTHPEHNDSKQTNADEPKVNGIDNPG